MRQKVGRKAFIALLLMSLAGFGCNPLLFPMYISGMFTAPTQAPEYEFYKKAKAEKKKSEIKIVILPDRGAQLSANDFGTERELAVIFERKLADYFKDNKEKVKIVPVKDVEAYKRTHPEWKTRFVELGKSFGADYIFNLELDALDLYEPRSHQQIMHGRCRVTLTIIDAGAKDDQEPVMSWPLSQEFPREGKTQIADLDTNPQKFKQTFFEKIGVKLCHLVTPYPTEEHIDVD
jgi:hypothetical protein